MPPGSIRLNQAQKLMGQRLGSHWMELHHPLCAICSTQTSYIAPSGFSPQLSLNASDSDYKCPICLDPRQYIGPLGQKWTTLHALLGNYEDQGYRNEFEELIQGQVWTIRTQPAFGIGQRAFLIKDPLVPGLVMWDCIAFMDMPTLQKIDELSEGRGIAHMIVSHPHYFSTTATWAAAFPGMTLWLGGEDFEPWYQRTDVVNAYNKSPSNGNPSPDKIATQIRLVTQKQTKLDASSGDFTILLLGGHFPASLVLLWRDNLFIADTIQVVPAALYQSDKSQRPGVNSVAFMWSYPNQVPLSVNEVIRLCEPLEKVDFTKAFGAFSNYNIWGYAKEKILQSRDIVVNRLQDRA